MNNITVIPGDGIGPEVVDATIQLLKHMNCPLAFEYIEAGEEAFKAGYVQGISDEALQIIVKNKVALKGPITTPVGYGAQSINVFLRKHFQTYANVRPIKLLPGITTPYSGRAIDFILVRENIEDLYAGIEFDAPGGAAIALKIMTPEGCERVCRKAFELAQQQGRQSVHCATKANILKKTEGLLKRTFERVAPNYPSIKAHHIIVDNCAHQMVRQPEQFEVLVMSNMNGDILSDLGSGLVGGLGVAPGMNLGDDVAIFEPVHGAAPDIAGQGLANPTAMIQTAVLMLKYIAMHDEATALEEALFKTLEAGVLTTDLTPKGAGVSTQQFVDAVAQYL